MNIYHYDELTGEYLGQGVADESPLEPGVWLIPAASTTEAPPTVATTQVAFWQGGQWAIRRLPRAKEASKQMPVTDNQPLEARP